MKPKIHPSFTFHLIILYMYFTIWKIPHKATVGWFLEWRIFHEGFFCSRSVGIKKKKKKKSHWLQTYQKLVLKCSIKHNYYGSNRKKWHLPPNFKGSYLSVDLIEAKIWNFKIFPIFGQFFFSTGAFLSSSVDPPFKESTDPGLMNKRLCNEIHFNKTCDWIIAFPV